MNGRVQDPSTGRFLSADPNIPDRLDPQSYNRYAYARNNPLSRVDPTGFEDKTDKSADQSGDSGDNFSNNNPAQLPDPRWLADPNGGGQTSSDQSGSQPADSDNAEGQSDGQAPVGADATPEGQAIPAQSAGPQVNQPTSEVTVTAPRASDLVYNWLVAPAFGWIDCAGGGCSSGQELWRITGPVRMAAAGGIVGKTAVVAVEAAPAAAQTSLLALMLQGSPDALVSIAQSLDLEGVESVEALVQQAPALETFLERVTEAAEALAEAAEAAVEAGGP
jgi:hypothetical protein